MNVLSPYSAFSDAGLVGGGDTCSSSLTRVEVSAPDSAFGGGGGTTDFFFFELFDLSKAILFKVFCLTKAGPFLVLWLERAGFCWDFLGLHLWCF